MLGLKITKMILIKNHIKLTVETKQFDRFVEQLWIGKFTWFDLPF